MSNEEYVIELVGDGYFSRITGRKNLKVRFVSYEDANTFMGSRFIHLGPKKEILKDIDNLKEFLSSKNKEEEVKLRKIKDFKVTYDVIS